jgi:ubiquinone/menaquinone biosynthesis C-methylase UbiE
MQRILEPEVMNNLEEAIEYNEMDFSEVNRLFVTDLLAFASKSIHSPIQSSSTTTSDGLGNDVLDLGTGTARIPVELCKQHPSVRVMASDAAIEMLELARYNIELAHLLDRVQLHHGDAKKLVFHKEYFDAVLSNSLIHHLPDCKDFFAEALRVLRPNGILFVRDLFRPENETEVERLVELHAANENERSRQLFRQSLQAGYRINEITEIIAPLGIPADAIQMTSDRHWTLAYRKPTPAAL